MFNSIVNLKTAFSRFISEKLFCKYIIYIGILVVFGVPLYSNDNLEIKTVVIDPGHGGRDPGANWPGIGNKEKTVTLDVSKKVAKFIKDRFPEVNVVLTRTSDVFLELYQRAEIANKLKADLFISIHVNSTSKTSPNGVEFWVLGLNRADENLEVVKKENASLKYEQDLRRNYGFDPTSPEGAIIMTMKQNQHLDQSIQFAKMVESRFVKEDNQLNRGTKQAGFAVLYKTSMPSVLVEIGFISNPDERQYITKETGQEKIANNIANAFADYKLKYESGDLKNINSKELLDKKIPSISPPSSFGDSKIVVVDNKPASEVMTKEKLEEFEKKENDAGSTTKANKWASPSSNVLIDKKDKQIVVLDDELSAEKIENKLVGSAVKNSKNTYNSSSYKDLTIKDEVKTSLDIYSKPPIKEPVTYSGKRKIDISSPQEKSQPKVLKNVDKSIKKVNEEPTKVPSYVTDDELKKEILDNAKRIHSNKSNIETRPVKTLAKSPELKNAPVKPSTFISGLEYKVQVKASVRQILGDDPILSLGEDLEESYENGLYKYMVGSFADQQSALNYQSIIRSKGISDAFVVKYLKGERVK